MEWLIAGLGNPGEKYRNTRHNAGFMVLDELAREMAMVWHRQNRFRAEVAESAGYVLVKPQTYMNLSGDAVGGIARYYKLPPERVLVVHDDLDILLGQVKAGIGKGPKVHHGLQSIDAVLGTPNYWRVRVGIEDRSREERQVLPGDRYVLMPLSEPEHAQIVKGVTSAVEKIAQIIGTGKSA